MPAPLPCPCCALAPLHRPPRLGQPRKHSCPAPPPPPLCPPPLSARRCRKSQSPNCPVRIRIMPYTVPISDAVALDILSMLQTVGYPAYVTRVRDALAMELKDSTFAPSMFVYNVTNPQGQLRESVCYLPPVRFPAPPGVSVCGPLRWNPPTEVVDGNATCNVGGAAGRVLLAGGHWRGLLALFHRAWRRAGWVGCMCVRVCEVGAGSVTSALHRPDAGCSCVPLVQAASPPALPRPSAAWASASTPKLTA